MSAAAPPLISGLGAVGAPRVMPLLEQRIIRRRRHRARLGIADGLAVIAATAVTMAMQWSDGNRAAPLWVAGAVFAVAWAAALPVLRAAARRRGAGERIQLLPVLHSAVVAVAVMAVLTSFTGWPLLRWYVTLGVPVGIVLLLVVRGVRMGRRARARARTSLAPRTVVVGSPAGIEHTIRALTAEPLGHDILGVVFDVPGADRLVVDGSSFAVLGSADELVRVARDLCVETVVVASGGDDPDYVRRLSWSLEGAATELVLATRLADVARSRIHFERAQSLALTRVSLPRFDRQTIRAKRALDVVVAVLALVPIALVTPFIALAIVSDSPGGVFFRQRRIGRDGREFDILKFRTMTSDAEARRAELDAANEGAGPLFKVRQDPRVTRVGAVLRRFSLDELPQFWNVLVGEMSVVGPRPPLPSEVRAYERDVFRRLYVQPGITGLWQVSGRSDLSWEQSVRLDLHYVENWSVVTDLSIIARTAAVMVRPNGAY